MVSEAMLFDIGSFDDLLRYPDITLALGEEPESVGVAVDAGTVRQLVVFGNRGWADPVHEISFTLFPLLQSQRLTRSKM
jgi:hypothetical protein